MSLESLFPNLANSTYQITSPTSGIYNCFAWAAGEVHRWWEAHPDSGHFWPTGATEEWTIDVVLDAYRAVGFEVCTDALHETGFGKIVVYVLDGEPTHAARLLDNGFWTSKLGPREDIEHTLDGLSGDVYGTPMVFLRRPVPASP